MSYAQRAMEAIDKLGWSQRRMAGHLGVTPATVTRWRNQSKQDAGEEATGENSQPSRHTVILIEQLAKDCQRSEWDYVYTGPLLRANIEITFKRLRKEVDRAETQLYKLLGYGGEICEDE